MSDILEEKSESVSEETVKNCAAVAYIAGSDTVRSVNGLSTSSIH